MPTRLTEEQVIASIETKLAGSLVRFIGFKDGKYLRAKNYVLLECVKHGPLEITYDKIAGGTGCRKCGNEIVSSIKTTDVRVITRQIDEICLREGWHFVGFDGGVYTSVDGKAVLKCPSHGNFSRRIADLKSRNYACPVCYKENMRKRNRMPEEEAILRWEESCRIKGMVFLGLIGAYEAADTNKAKLLCPKHGIWNASYSNFVLSGSTCSSCSRVGFNYLREAFVYALVGDGFIKIGVTNSPTKRLEVLRRNTPFDFEVLEVVRVKSGNKAHTIERHFHKKYETAGLSGFDGCTEWLRFDPEILEELRAI